MQATVLVYDKTVVLLTEDGLGKWSFTTSEEAKILFDLLVMSIEVESEISTLCNQSI